MNHRRNSQRNQHPRKRSNGRPSGRPVGRRRHFGPNQRDRPAPGSRLGDHPFLKKTPVDPSPRIYLEAGCSEMTVRVMDLLCPIGMGQRGLIVAPPGSGKTTYLKHICKAITTAHPEAKVFCLLIDERPEEVTDFKRSVDAEVHGSSSDQPYDQHVKAADEVIKLACDEADRGKDVFVLLDSLTRLARVHNSESRGRGRTLSGGMDADAIAVPRRIFGAARKIEEGGSLAILATILVETGSRMDEVIFQEFKGTGNMEIFLSREISGRRIYPAVDVHRTGTRKEELLFTAEELPVIHKLRRILADLTDVEAATTMVEILTKYPTNQELLIAIDKAYE